MSGAARVALVAALAAAPFLFVGLGAAPFDDPGEGMHAQIARELRAGGDPLALSLAGVRYVDKPPLLYALVAGAFAIGGER
ncbi:MAG: ArnT family glycosyltransferase, partial [Candidatus Rokuibacteriota bacterium]